MDMDGGLLREVAALLEDARRVLVLSGAGISAASGLRTYRGTDGMWSDVALLAAHHVDSLPGSLPIVWATKGRLRADALVAEPNAGHVALARLGERKVVGGGWLTVATQNIDGLHQKAGSSDVLELHGSVLRTRCSKRGCSCPPFEDTNVPAEGELPSCPQCGRPARPAIVLFGERLPAKVLQAATRAAATCDMLLVVGTSGVVYPAMGLLDVAARRGVPVVLVNLERWPTPSPGVTHTLLGPGEELLPSLIP